MRTITTTRRGLFRMLGAGAATAALSRAADDPWAQVPIILARIRPPVFPKRDFEITKYGAVGDGAKDSTEAFRKAIDACNAAGGGRVVVPAGRFLTGAIHLKTGVNLHVTENGTILFSRDPKAYLPVVFTRWEGTECMGYSPFIYAFGQKNIAITGSGTLDGQASCEFWWPWKGRSDCGWKPGDPNQLPARTALIKAADDNVPVEKRIFGDGSLLRPQFIQPYRCENVLIEGLRIRNSPMWEMNPVLCRHVTIRNVDILSHGPNNDGCDPESCVDVLIEGCVFDTGDDCIALKSGRNADGRRLNAPIENVVVRGCTMKDGHGGVTVGSEISGGARWVFAENCKMDSPNLDRALRLKNNAARGGLIEHVYMRNVEVGQVADSVLSIDFNYEEGKKGGFTPVARHIGMQKVNSKKSKYALYLRGFENAPIEDVRVEKCTFDNVEKGELVEFVKDLKIADVKVNGKARALAAAAQ